MRIEAHLSDKKRSATAIMDTDALIAWAQELAQELAGQMASWPHPLAGGMITLSPTSPTEAPGSKLDILVQLCQGEILVHVFRDGVEIGSALCRQDDPETGATR